MTTNKTIVGLSGLIDRHRMTEKQAALFLGVPFNTLKHWLNGTREPSATLDRLIDVLCTVETLNPDLFASMVPDAPPLPPRGRPKR